MKHLVADLHVHPGLKGFANEPYPEENQNRTIWDFYPKKEKALKELNFAIRGAIKELAKDSQAHLNGCADGHLMLPFISIYPVERQMFALERRAPFGRLLYAILPDKNYAALGAAVAGMPKARVARILERNVFQGKNDGVNYFEQYELELDYLKRQMEKPSSKYPGYRFQIARSYKEVQRLTRADNHIAGILTVEGAHSFGHYKYNTTFSKTYAELAEDERQLLRSSFKDNIKKVKRAEDTPFFVTFCHHFNNLLAGHARSMSGKSNLIPFLPWPNLPGMRHIFNQEPNLNAGFSELGREVMELLLDRTEGRRILIDAKHMSSAARKDFYEYVKKRREQGDAIPIIFSHGAVNGWPTLKEAQQHPEDEKIDKDAFFSRWQINLTDEDILAIYDSDGLIGLVLHEGRMPGDKFKKMARKYKKRIDKFAKRNSARAKRKKAAYEHKLKHEYLKLVWSNIFHMVRVVSEARKVEGEPADGWKMIAIGSDFDGIINPFNTYPDVCCFMDLKKELSDYLKEGGPVNYAINGEVRHFHPEEIGQLMFGKTPEELLDAVFYDNADRFLKKYFNAGYLESKAVPRMLAN